MIKLKEKQQLNLKVKISPSIKREIIGSKKTISPKSTLFIQNDEQQIILTIHTLSLATPYYIRSLGDLLGGFNLSVCSTAAEFTLYYKK